METGGFIITSKGDPSCGISPCEWTLSLNGTNIEFESEEDENWFKQKLKEAFEVVADDAKVETIEKYTIRNERIDY